MSILITFDFARLEQSIVVRVREAVADKYPDMPEPEREEIVQAFMTGMNTPLDIEHPRTIAMEARDYPSEIKTVEYESRDLPRVRELQRDRYMPKNKRFRLPASATNRNGRWKG